MSSTTATARAMAMAGNSTTREWVERIWGDSPEGSAVVFEHRGTEYMIAGDPTGMYAWYISDVEAWLEYTETTDETSISDGGWYQEFCENNAPCGDVDLAAAYYAATETNLSDDGAAVILTDRDREIVDAAVEALS